ncbi:MAG TPA: endonuclease MutS2, partial [Candidatus Methylomirabilis sp.]
MRVLEFPAVLERLAAEAASVLGVERARALAPSADPLLVVRRLAETGEGCTLLSKGPVPGLAQARDIREFLARARIPGARLGTMDLLVVADTLEAAEQVRRHLRQAGPDLRGLSGLADGLRPPPALDREIRRSVLPDGGVADGASPDLSRLRAQVRQAREAARETLQALLANREILPVIAEPVVTLRNDRYVIPVLPGYRTHLAGV